MRCECCGKTLFENIFANIEGARMLVCPECAGAFGTEIEAVSETRILKAKQGFNAPNAPRQKIELSEGLDLRQDFGIEIRKKRQLLNLTIEELAKKIFEKESTLHKIESQKLVPSDALIGKLEKALQLKLKEKIQD